MATSRRPSDSLSGHFRELRASLAEFVKSLGRLGVIALTGTAVSIGSLIAEQCGMDVKLPAWAWITIGGIGVLVGPFAAFHRVRVERDSLRPTASADAMVIELRALRLVAPSDVSHLPPDIREKLKPRESFLRVTLRATNPSSETALIKGELVMSGPLRDFAPPSAGWLLELGPRSAPVVTYCMDFALTPELDRHLTAAPDQVGLIEIALRDGFNDLKPATRTLIPATVRV